MNFLTKFSGILIFLSFITSIYAYFFNKELVFFFSNCFNHLFSSLSDISFLSIFWLDFFFSLCSFFSSVFFLFSFLFFLFSFELLDFSCFLSSFFFFSCFLSLFFFWPFWSFFFSSFFSKALFTESRFSCVCLSFFIFKLIKKNLGFLNGDALGMTLELTEILLFIAITILWF